METGSPEVQVRFIESSLLCVCVCVICANQACRDKIKSGR